MNSLGFSKEYLRYSLERFRRVASLFRILDDWTFEVDDCYAGQVTVHKAGKVALLHPWPEGEEEPDDFLFHEVLHCVIRALECVDEEERHDAEELVVRSICLYVRNSVRNGFVYAGSEPRETMLDEEKNDDTG